MNEENDDDLYTIYFSPVNYGNLEPTVEYISSFSIEVPTSEVDEFIKRSSEIASQANEEYLTIDSKIPVYIYDDDEYGNPIVDELEVEMKNLIDPNNIT